jgi:hypothetical protein
MNRTAQLACVWAGPVMVVVWVLSWVVLAQFIPPPSPEKTPQQVVGFYAGRVDEIRLGMLLTLFASALLVPFAAVISTHMRRIEGPRSVLAQIQLVSAGLLSLEFIIPLLIFQTAAYRLDAESARLIQMLNDLGWLLFVGVISSAVVQFASIGFAILIDPRERPVFPRWAGYFNLWVALLVSPAGIVPFFKHGPFAWNGLLAFFMPLAVFVAWIAVMVVILLRAIDEDVLEPTAPGGVAYGR